jgi:hypothetical protein
MRRPWTSEQLRAAVAAAERELEGAIAASLAHDPAARTLIVSACPLVHETVVGLVTLFRDRVAGTGEVATLIAREYSKCDAKCTGAAPETPALACIQRVLDLVRAARERHLQG